MRPDDVLDVGEVAELLKITRGQVYALANRGDLPHVRIGRYVRFRRGAIERWFLDRKGT